MNSVLKFFQEVRTEFGRIEWPGIDEWMESTRVVLIVVLLFTIFFAIINQSASFILGKILSGL